MHGLADFKRITAVTANNRVEWLLPRFSPSHPENLYISLISSSSCYCVVIRVPIPKIDPISSCLVAGNLNRHLYFDRIVTFLLLFITFISNYCLTFGIESGLISSSIPTWNFVFISNLLHAFFMSCSSHSAWCTHPMRYFRLFSRCKGDCILLGFYAA